MKNNKIKGRLSFTELYKLSFEKCPFFNIKRFEVFGSIICALISCIFGYLLIVTNMVDSITLITQNILLYTSMGLLGLLGFLVSGLAIISGTVSNKVASSIDAEGKFNSLISILFSYYFVGAVIAGFVAVFIGTYFLISLEVPLNKLMYIILDLILSYGFFFAIFSSVSLLGTSIDIFRISYLYSKEEKTQMADRVNGSLVDHKIDALTFFLINKFGLTKEEFHAVLVDCIDRDCPEELKTKVLKAAENYYSIDL
ncbi:MAG: hypothetical protein ACYDEJ_08465 [Desulfitobacteriaceae bacterium]